MKTGRCSGQRALFDTLEPPPVGTHDGALVSLGECYSKPRDSHSYGPCVPRLRTKSRQAAVKRDLPLGKGLRIGQVTIFAGLELMPPLVQRADTNKLSNCINYVANGGLSDVYHGRLLDGTHVAIKVLRLSADSESTDSIQSKVLQHAARELHTWFKLSHPNVLPLLGLAEFRHQIAVVAPWMKNGSLKEYLEQKRVDRWQMCSQVAAGLEHLHKSGIVHGDIRAHNILVSDEGKPQITDFGLSKNLLFRTESSSFDSNRLRWLAPELIVRGEDSASASIPGDVYALGMTVLEVLTGEKPYDEYKSDVQVTMAVVQGTPPIRPPMIAITTKVGDERWTILTECWNNRPELRPSARDVKRMTPPLAPLPSPPPAAVAPESLSGGINRNRPNGGSFWKIHTGTTSLIKYIQVANSSPPLPQRSKHPKTDDNSSNTTLRDASRAKKYETRGEWERATHIRRQIWYRNQRYFGHRAEQTIKSLEALAHTYVQRSMFEAAATHQLEAYNWRMRSYDENNPATVQSKYCLASIYAKQFKLSAAEELAMQVWTQWRAASGSDDAKTQQVTRLLASIRYKRNQREKFGRYLQRAQTDIPNTDSFSALSSVVVQIGPTDLDDEIDRLVASGIARIACSSSCKHPSNDQSQSLLSHGTTLDGFDLTENPSTPPVRGNETLKSGAKVRPCIGTQTSVEQGFKYLIDSGCPDVTNQLDPLQLSEAPIAFSACNDIWKGRLLGGGELVVIKCSRICTDSNIQAKLTKLQRVVREAHAALLLSNIQHPNVMELLGVARFKGRIALVSPWMSNGTLMAYVLRKLNVDCWELSQQVADGLSTIHGMGVLHGDLKAANVFVSDQGVPKIGDFGNTNCSGGCLDYTPTTNIGGGTARHMAPELLKEESDRSAPADVYALAMTTLEVMTRRRPYSEYASEPYVTLLVTQGVPPQRPKELAGESKFGDERWAIINECWRMDPQLRPTANEIRDRVGIVAFLRKSGTQNYTDA
ncbi:hypothetical protein FRC12_017792 [Ceratobasidium sp. 428]|nr:hypothetical protein FRC12_017792 [Ceratobasidium sp. 428]